MCARPPWWSVHCAGRAACLRGGTAPRAAGRRRPGSSNAWRRPHIAATDRGGDVGIDLAVGNVLRDGRGIGGEAGIVQEELVRGVGERCQRQRPGWGPVTAGRHSCCDANVCASYQIGYACDCRMAERWVSDAIDREMRPAADILDSPWKYCHASKSCVLRAQLTHLYREATAAACNWKNYAPANICLLGAEHAQRAVHACREELRWMNGTYTSSPPLCSDGKHWAGGDRTPRRTRRPMRWTGATARRPSCPFSEHVQQCMHRTARRRQWPSCPRRRKPGTGCRDSRRAPAAARDAHAR